MRQDRPLGGVVDRRRLVPAEAGAEDRLALGAPGHLSEHARDVLARPAAGFQPIG
jgi:hypothetical protein